MKAHLIFSTCFLIFLLSFTGAVYGDESELLHQQFLEDGLIGPFEVKSRELIDRLLVEYQERKIDWEEVHRAVLDRDELGLYEKVGEAIRCDPKDMWLQLRSLKAKRGGEPHSLHQDPECVLCPASANVWVAIRNVSSTSSMLWGVLGSHRFAESAAELLASDPELSLCALHDVPCTLRALSHFGQRRYGIDASIAPFVSGDLSWRSGSCLRNEYDFCSCSILLHSSAL
jgi:hypothetical protein